MKRILLIIAVILLLPGGAARATESITLNYEDIAARVERANVTVRLARLALAEAENALGAAQDDYREQKAQGTNPGKALIQQRQQAVEKLSLQYAQTLAQQIKAARQLFIRCLQLQNNIELQQDNVTAAEQAAASAGVRFARGLISPAAASEAERQLNQAASELAAMRRQPQTALAELKSATGYATEDELLTGAAPPPDLDFVSSIDMRRDCGLAVSNSYALKLLQVERAYTFGSAARRQLDIQIEQQQAAVTQAVEQHYYALQDVQAKLTLAEAELAQAGKQLTAAETNFTLGRISLAALTRERAAHQARQTERDNAALSLTAEIADYQARLGGLN